MFAISKTYDYQHWYRLVPGHDSSKIIYLDNTDIGAQLNSITGYPLFIRLTSRSPKDYQSEHYEFNCKANSLDDIVQMVNGSSRCQEDLKDYFEDNEPIGLVLQPFNDKISLKNEFRAFVYHKKLVAISAVTEPNNRLSDDDIMMVNDYINGLELNDKFNNYVADICVNGSIIFIEINPYEPEITDSILFDWVDDAEILFNDNPGVPCYRFE